MALAWRDTRHVLLSLDGTGFDDSHVSISVSEGHRSLPFFVAVYLRRQMRPKNPTNGLGAHGLSIPECCHDSWPLLRSRLAYLSSTMLASY